LDRQRLVVRRIVEESIAIRAPRRIHAAFPMGLVALMWIRLYKPLLAAGLPQNPANRGYEGRGFVRDAFRNLDTVSHHDLRAGTSFSGDMGLALRRAIKEAADTMAKTPV
jgi:hypothetical protein